MKNFKLCPLTSSTRSHIAEPITVMSYDLNDVMKNEEHEDCEKLFEQVQMLAAGSVGQISNCNSKV